MNFLIVEPSPLPILIPLGPKYSPQDPEACHKIIDFVKYFKKSYIKDERRTTSEKDFKL